MIIKSDNIFSVEFLGVSPPNDKVIPSGKNLTLHLSLHVNDAFPIYETIGYKEEKNKEVDAISPLRINVCRMTFNFDNSQLFIDLSTDQLSWMKGYNVLFFKDISKQEIEFLSKWKDNRSLSVGFQTEGFAIVDGSILEFQLNLKVNQFKLGIDDFESLFLKNTGLQYTYTREFGLTSPLIDNLSSRPALQEFYIYICNLQNNLEHALRALRLSGNTLEALILIRQPLDVIKDLKNNSTWVTNIAKELYVDTNILTDLNPQSSPGGGQTAATQIVQKLLPIFDFLFEFSSKAFHTKTKYQNPVTFQMNPEYCDAEFSLSLALNFTNYLIESIKRSCHIP